MKTKHPTVRTAQMLREDDIRAYAAHLYVQSGRIPNRDIENWLEAKACLDANLRPALPERRRSPRGRRLRGFTMPASDASLWAEREEVGPPEA